MVHEDPDNQVIQACETQCSCYGGGAGPMHGRLFRGAFPIQRRKGSDVPAAWRNAWGERRSGESRPGTCSWAR
jgi:hypothetical protein